MAKPALLPYPYSITQVNGVVNRVVEESFKWPSAQHRGVGKISENLYENIGASNNRSSPRTPRSKGFYPLHNLGRQWHGKARQGTARHGKARHGKDGQVRK